MLKPAATECQNFGPTSGFEKAQDGGIWLLFVKSREGDIGREGGVGTEKDIGDI